MFYTSLSLQKNSESRNPNKLYIDFMITSSIIIDAWWAVLFISTLLLCIAKITSYEKHAYTVYIPGYARMYEIKHSSFLMQIS